MLYEITKHDGYVLRISPTLFSVMYNRRVCRKVGWLIDGRPRNSKHHIRDKQGTEMQPCVEGTVKLRRHCEQDFLTIHVWTVRFYVSAIQRHSLYIYINSVPIIALTLYGIYTLCSELTSKLS
jgi:hypothetical protein